jgi:glycine/D-amino acid oxidase-like deaminating enzyme
MAVTTTQQQQSSPMKKPRKHSSATTLQWAQPVPAIREIQSMGDNDSIAQVHPRLLCQALWEHVRARGCVLRKGRVIGAVHREDGTLVGAQLADTRSNNDEDVTVPATHLLYAAGPWNANIMKGIKGHSVVAPTRETLSEAVFFYEEGDNDTSCEVFVRPDATAFCTGEPNDPVATLNVEPGEEEIEQDKANKLRQSIRHFTGWSKMKDDDTIVNACYQPVTDDFLPVLGELNKRAAGASSCYMAGGLNCWGILLSLAAGEAMADLIVTGRSNTVSLQAFRPSRFRNLKPVPASCK